MQRCRHCSIGAFEHQQIITCLQPPPCMTRATPLQTISLIREKRIWWLVSEIYQSVDNYRETVAQQIAQSSSVWASCFKSSLAEDRWTQWVIVERFILQKEVEGRMGVSQTQSPAEKARSEKDQCHFVWSLVWEWFCWEVIFTLFRVLGGSADEWYLQSGSILSLRSCGSDHPAASPTTIGTTDRNQ